MDAIDIVEQYSNAGGYGLFCGKKCAAQKEAACVPYKRGKMKGQIPLACQQRVAAAAAQNRGGERSKTGLIVGSLVGVALIVGIIVIVRKRKG